MTLEAEKLGDGAADDTASDDNDPRHIKKIAIRSPSPLQFRGEGWGEGRDRKRLDLRTSVRYCLWRLHFSCVFPPEAA
jgi:hypothetical protein